MQEVCAGYESLHGDGGSAARTRDVIEVVGIDASRYLQGQLSQDVVAMVGDSAWSFLLGPNGKVDAWLRVHRCDSERYLLEVDAGWGDVVRTRLSRFLLRTKATIGDVMTWSLVERRWDPQSVRLGLEVPEGMFAAPAVGPAVAGIDILCPAQNAELGHELAGVTVSAAALERYRIAHGIPQLGSELTDETIPGEAGQWVIDESVSFTKGCYTGQELVARIDSRGNNVPHPIRLLVLDGDVRVGHSVLVDGSEVGVVTSAAPGLGEGLHALALARVGRSVVPGGVVEIHSDAGPIAGSVVEPGTVR